MVSLSLFFQKIFALNVDNSWFINILLQMAAWKKIHKVLDSFFKIATMQVIYLKNVMAPYLTKILGCSQQLLKTLHKAPSHQDSITTHTTDSQLNTILWRREGEPGLMAFQRAKRIGAPKYQVGDYSKTDFQFELCCAVLEKSQINFMMSCGDIIKCSFPLTVFLT